MNYLSSVNVLTISLGNKQFNRWNEKGHWLNTIALAEMADDFKKEINLTRNK